VSLKWSDLTVCGIPVIVDPHEEPGSLKLYDGQVLVIEMHFDGDTFIGATAHADSPPQDTETEE